MHLLKSTAGVNFFHSSSPIAGSKPPGGDPDENGRSPVPSAPPPVTTERKDGTARSARPTNGTSSLGSLCGGDGTDPCDCSPGEASTAFPFFAAGDCPTAGDPSKVAVPGWSGERKPRFSARAARELPGPAAPTPRACSLAATSTAEEPAADGNALAAAEEAAGAGAPLEAELLA